jgi:outer membrane lipoprotein SlyB
VLLVVWLAGCSPTYSPDTYASNAVQQANKVDRGVVIGVRPVDVSADATLGAATGAAAGGAIGSTAGGSVTSTLGAVGGALLGGLVGTGAEKAVANTTAWEYIVRKPNGDLVSVTQKDAKPLSIGQKVLVIAGNQARIVPDYTADVVTHAPAAPPQPPPPAVPPPITETPLPPVGATPATAAPVAAPQTAPAAAPATPATITPAPATPAPVTPPQVTPPQTPPAPAPQTGGGPIQLAPAATAQPIPPP